jgi:AraC-like DNA-binding protein
MTRESLIFGGTMVDGPAFDAHRTLRKNVTRPKTNLQGSHEAMCRVHFLREVPALLQELGLSAVDVLGVAGLSPEFLHNADNLMPVAARQRLLATCAARSNCADFGLLVGQRSGLGAMSALGLLLQSAPDVRTALHELISLLPLRDPSAFLTLWSYESEASLSFSVCERTSDDIRQICDAGIAIMFNMLRTLCGPDWLPIEVTLPYRRPSDIAPLQRFFKAPLRFDSEEGALVFRSDWLGRKLPAANAEVHHFIKARLVDERVAEPRGLAGAVRRILTSELLNRGSSAERIARLFGMHRRTLSRRLKHEGTNFKTMLEEARYDAARHLIAATSLPLAEIAVALGYSESSAFTRAFSRWSGATPSSWRAVHAGHSAFAPQ